jgi:hypothetical protein
MVPVERAQPAPQHEQVAARHDVDRIDLLHPQPAQHLPHPSMPAQHLPHPVDARACLRLSGAGQVLGAHRSRRA